MFTEKHNINVIFFDGEKYPEKLKGLEDAPFVLFYKGSDVLWKKKVCSHWKHPLPEIYRAPSENPSEIYRLPIGNL